MTPPPRSPAIAQRLVDAYFTTLRQHLPTMCIRQLDMLSGASEEQLLRLRQHYPAAPPELLRLLQRVNGTYWEAIAPASGVVVTETVTTVTGTVTAAGGGAGAATAAASTASSSSTPASSSSTPASSPSTGGAGGSAGVPSAAATGSGGGAPPKQGAVSAAASFIFAQLGVTATTSGKSASADGKRKGKKEKIAVPILGSALGACPYFLKSVEQMLQPNQPFPPLSAKLPRQPGSEDDAFMKLRWGPGAAGNARDGATARPPSGPIAASSARPVSSASGDGAERTAAASSRDTASASSDAKPVATGSSSGAAASTVGGENKGRTIASLYAGHIIRHEVPLPATLQYGVNCAAWEAAVQAQEAAAAAAAADRPLVFPSASTSSSTTISGAGSASTTVGSAAAAASASSSSGGTGPVTSTISTASTVGATPTATNNNSNPAQSTEGKGRPATSSTPTPVSRTVYVDPRINTEVDISRWLVFADSIYPHYQQRVTISTSSSSSSAAAAATAAAQPPSSASASTSGGGSKPTPSAAETPLYKTAESRLYLDFDPVEGAGGSTGQVIQYVRSNPDTFTVIAGDFGEYLKQLMANEYEFTEELDADEDEEEKGDDDVDITEEDWAHDVRDEVDLRRITIVGEKGSTVRMEKVSISMPPFSTAAASSQKPPKQ